MIQVVKGSDHQLEQYVMNTYTNSSDLVILNKHSFIFPHVLFRGIVDFFIRNAQTDFVTQLLNANKVPLGLIYEELVAELSEEEQRQLDFCAARTASNYAHSPIAKSALIKTCAELILLFHERIPFRIIALKPEKLDVNSIDLIKHLYHLYPDQAPDLIIVYNEDWGDDERDKTTGISHYFGLDTVTVLQAFVYAFERTASTLIDLSLCPSDQFDHSTMAEIPSVLTIDSDDAQAYYSLQQQLTFSQQEAHQLMHTIRRCFRMYDFYNTLFMGLQARSKIIHQLSEEDRADLLHMIGLSAHIRHFFTQGNQVLADFLKEIFKEALEYEQRYAHRLALLYRLTVTHSRRKNDVNAALLFVQQAQLEDATVKHEKDVLGMAWIHNIHSYVKMKQGLMQEAIELHEQAYTSVMAIDVDDQQIYKHELLFTRAILAENLATLNGQQQNFDAMYKWYEIETNFSKDWPYLHAAAKAEWQSFFFQQLMLKEAKEQAEEGILLCRKSFNYILEYYFCLCLAEITSRQGIITEAIFYNEACLLFNDRVGHSYPTITAVDLTMSTARLCLFAGDTAKAQQLIFTIENNQQAVSPLEKISYHELVAHLFVLQGKLDKANDAINQAIEIAVEDSSADILFSTLLSAARISTLANRPADASQALTQALELLTAEVNGLQFTPSSVDLAELHLGLAEVEHPSLTHLAEAIRLLSSSLHAHTSAWWKIPKLLKLLNLLSADERKDMQQATGNSLTKIYQAALQREDCKPYFNLIHQNIIR